MVSHNGTWSHGIYDSPGGGQLYIHWCPYMEEDPLERDGIINKKSNMNSTIFEMVIYSVYSTWVEYTMEYTIKKAPVIIR